MGGTGCVPGSQRGWWDLRFTEAKERLSDATATPGRRCGVAPVDLSNRVGPEPRTSSRMIGEMELATNLAESAVESAAEADEPKTGLVDLEGANARSRVR